MKNQPYNLVTFVLVTEGRRRALSRNGSSQASCLPAAPLLCGVFGMRKASVWYSTPGSRAQNHAGSALAHTAHLVCGSRAPCPPGPPAPALQSSPTLCPGWCQPGARCQSALPQHPGQQWRCATAAAPAAGPRESAASCVFPCLAQIFASSIR